MDTSKHRDALTAEKGRLEAELNTVGKRDPGSTVNWDATSPVPDDDRSDINDNADRMEDLENNEAISEQLETELAEVVAALARIEDGTYGKCETCGKEIEADRLAANPAARTCKEHLS